MNLLWDAGRKSLDLVADAIGEGLAQGQILEERRKEDDEGQRKGVVWRGEEIRRRQRKSG